MFSVTPMGAAAGCSASQAPGTASGGVSGIFYQ